MALKLEIDTLGSGSFDDYTSVLMYESLTVRANTVDFSLYDYLTLGHAALNPPSAFTTQSVRIVALSWLGIIYAVETRDPVDIRNGHSVTLVTATNSALPIPVAAGASMTMSDQPTSSAFDYLLEDGSGHYLMETGSLTDPGALQLEGGDAIAYRGLSIRKQANSSIPSTVVVNPFGTFTMPGTSTLGTLTTFQGGLWPGLQFTLFSNNQSISGALYTVSEVTVTFPTSKPVYEIKFGLVQSDPIWTLKSWVRGITNLG